MNFKYYSLGITDGSLTTIIGRSGCGKTTWALQSAANIVRPFPNSYIIHEDIEGGIVESRKQQLTQFYGEDFKKKYIARNTGITNENFYQRIKMLYDLKMMNYKEYEYDTGLYDTTGNRIYKLQPTVVLLDSVAMLMPEKYTEEEEISGQMAATATAKANNALFKRIIPMLKSANIIFIAINHVRKKVELNPFSHTKAQVSYLKPDEYMPGGDMPGYLANVLLRFDDSKLNPDKTYGIDGSLVDIHLLKSRNAKAGQYCTMVFNQAEGFDNDLSTFVLLKDNDKIKGAGAYQYVEGHPEYKFTQKKFKTMLQENSEFRDIVSECAFKVLSEGLEASHVTPEQSLEDSKSSITGNIYGRVLSMIPV
jgi:RecA/RadA recombinase